MEPIREKIEDFMRRYGYEGNRVLRVLAASMLIVAILVVGGWLLLGSLTIPRVSTTGPVVRNGVAAIVACGEKRGFEVVSAAPEPQTGTWSREKRGECTVWYHHPPDEIQRENRHQRAQSQ